MQKDISARIIGGNGIRIEADFYPTPREATVALMEFIKLDKGVIIREPACGENAIVNVLREYGHQVIATDISMGCDFFDMGIAHTQAGAIITNPPFALAQKFIEKSLDEAPFVAMLLKAHYWHASKRSSLFKNNPPAFILPLTWRPNFFGSKSTGSPTMDFQWTVWIKGENDTRYRLLEKPATANQNKLL